MSHTDRTPRPVRTLGAEEAVLTKAVGRTADQLDLTNAILARVLGVSDATASRLRSGSYMLKMGSKEAELAILLVRLYRGLDAIGGGDVEAARSWLRTHNLALLGKPIDLFQTISGITASVMYVDAHRARI